MPAPDWQIGLVSLLGVATAALLVAATDHIPARRASTQIPRLAELPPPEPFPAESGELQCWVTEPTPVFAPPKKATRAKKGRKVQPGKKLFELRPGLAHRCPTTAGDGGWVVVEAAEGTGVVDRKRISYQAPDLSVGIAAVRSGPRGTTASVEALLELVRQGGEQTPAWPLLQEDLEKWVWANVAIEGAPAYGRIQSIVGCPDGALSDRTVLDLLRVAEVPALGKGRVARFSRGDDGWVAVFLEDDDVYAAGGTVSADQTARDRCVAHLAVTDVIDVGAAFGRKPPVAAAFRHLSSQGVVAPRGG